MTHLSPSGLIRCGALIFTCIALALTGCTKTGSDIPSENPAEAVLYASCLEIADIFQDIYAQAFHSGSLDSLDTQEEIVSVLGKKGYCASDADNQINMENSEKFEDFLAAAEAGDEADVTVLLVMEGGSVVYYDFQAQGRSISVQRCTLYWENSEPKAGYYEAFTAEKWCYTENGYFFFGQYRMPGHDGPPREIGIRVKPLVPDYRGYCRKYVTPIGYNRNNMLISD